MAPSKSSSSRSSRASKAAPYPPLPIASSSKSKLDEPTDVPESLTPDYVPVPHAKRELDEDDRGRLIHEVRINFYSSHSLRSADCVQLIGFHPRTILDDFTEKARMQIYPTVGAVEGWATKMVAGKGDEYQREVDIVCLLHLLRLVRKTTNTDPFAGSSLPRDTFGKSRR